MKKTLNRDNQRQKKEAKKQKESEKSFVERYLSSNIGEDPYLTRHPEQDPRRAALKPEAIAAINSDQEVRQKTRDVDEEQADEGAAFFGDAFIREHKLTGDNPGGASDRERAAHYRNMVQTTETSMAHLKQAQKDKIRDIETHADSEEEMGQAIDFEILDGDAKQENLLREYLRKVDRQTGDDEMEARFRTTEKARQIRREIGNLKFEQMNVKERYQETYPEDTQKIKTKLKAKAQRIHGASLRERTGQSIDREPDEGFW